MAFEAEQKHLWDEPFDSDEHDPREQWRDINDVRKGCWQAAAQAVADEVRKRGGTEQLVDAVRTWRKRMTWKDLDEGAHSDLNDAFEALVGENSDEPSLPDSDNLATTPEPRFRIDANSSITIEGERDFAYQATFSDGGYTLAHERDLAPIPHNPEPFTPEEIQKKVVGTLVNSAFGAAPNTRLDRIEERLKKLEER